MAKHSKPKRPYRVTKHYEHVEFQMAKSARSIISAIKRNPGCVSAVATTFDGADQALYYRDDKPKS